MLSRVAENLYWMSRYVERAENVARLLDVGFHLELDAGLTEEQTGTGPIENILGILACRDDFQRLRAIPATGQPHGALGLKKAVTTTRATETPVLDSDAQDAVLRFLTFDKRGCHSILSMIARARENARATQETLSAEAWSQVNRLYLYLSGPARQRRFQASPFRFYDSIKQACILFDGLVDSTLPRTEVFHFLQLGRYLERVDHDRPDHQRQPAPAPFRRGAAGYNGRAGDRPAAAQRPLGRPAAQLLGLRGVPPRVPRPHRPDQRGPLPGAGRRLPRALRFGVARCLESLHEIAGERDADSYASEAERLLGRLDSELRYLDPGETLRQGPAASSWLPSRKPAAGSARRSSKLIS